MSKQNTLERYAQTGEFNRRGSRNPSKLFQSQNRICEEQKIRNIILNVLEDYGYLMSRGELYVGAILAGYTGEQERLEEIANKMAKERSITSKKMGMMQNNYYKLRERKQ